MLSERPENTAGAQPVPRLFSIDSYRAEWENLNALGHDSEHAETCLRRNHQSRVHDHERGDARTGGFARATHTADVAPQL